MKAKKARKKALSKWKHGLEKEEIINLKTVFVDLDGNEWQMKKIKKRK